MNLSWLSLRDLDYLVAVAEKLHFGRAAAACHVSQPALSAQVRKLEEQLGFPVFERTNRSVMITPEGELAVRQARVVLEEARKLGEIGAGRAAEPLSGTFRIGAIATIGPYLWPYILTALRKKYPKLKPILREGMTDGLIRDLRAGELDAVVASPTFADDGLRELPLYFEPFMLAVSKGHDLARRPAVATSDLDAREMLLLEDGHCLRDQAVGTCTPSRRGGTRTGLHAASLESLRHLVAAGLGYTLFPNLAVRDSNRAIKDLVTYREFAGARQPGRVVSLYARERFSRMKDAELLAELIRKNRPAGLDPA